MGTAEKEMRDGRGTSVGLADRLAAVSPARAFLFIGGLTMLVLLLITPPFMVPDETTHFNRAYSVSMGKVLPDYEGGKPGYWGPASIQRSIEAYFGPGSYPTPFSFTWEQLQRPLEPEALEFKEMRPEAIYSPLGYLPQVAGIVVGRELGAGPVGILMMARFGNLLAAMLLVLWAFRQLPVGRPALLFVALLPMSQHLFASASPDAMTISGGLLFAAAVWRSILRDDWSMGQVAVILLAAVLMCSTRWIYAPLLCAGAIAPFCGNRDARKWVVAAVLVAAAGAIFLLSAAWADAMGSLASSREGVDGEANIQLLKTEPVSMTFYLIRSLIHDAPILVAGMMGILGWGNIYLFLWVYLLLCLLAPIALMASVHGRDAGAGQPGPWALLWIAGLIAVVVMLIQAGLFVVWTRSGAPYVEGVQGRYFQPLILPVFLLLLSRLRLAIGHGVFRLAYPALLAGLAVAGLGTCLRLVMFFKLI